MSKHSASSSSEDTNHKLSKKELQQQAKQYRIKNYKAKTPAALRRAIRRHEGRRQQQQAQAQEAYTFQQQQTNIRKAYAEHRLRYLFAPSRFVHSGTHEEFLLEKDTDLLLPDTYLESELTALPVDPYHFYVYWDFDTPMAQQVQALFPYYTFVLRTYDVTDILFNGHNAHLFWDVACHPFALEWYVNTPVSGRNVCVELGFMDGAQFKALLRSEMMAIPPEQVSPVVQDVFGKFVPTAVLAPLQVPKAVEPPVPSPLEESPASLPEPEAQIQQLFFQPYQPAPQPAPRPFRPLIPVAEQPVKLQPPPVAQPQPVQPAVLRPQTPRIESPSDSVTYWVEQPQPSAPKPLTREIFPHHEIRDGREIMAQWLGDPIAERIVWTGHAPEGVSPFFFHEWVTDPYDQAMLVSYSIWPWEWHEYVPLGASDWTVRHFLGASLSSWFKPGASERMIQWQQLPGGSENVLWHRPTGASERSWQQPRLGGSEQVWGPSSRSYQPIFLNFSGWGLRP